MYSILKLLIFIKLFCDVSTDTFSVKISTEHHINEIDKRFLSFTIDPKYLFSTNEKYNSKECMCMASSLSPAYIRIAGPSTTSLTFHNTTIAIEEPIEDQKPIKFKDIFTDNLSRLELFKRRGIFDRYKRNNNNIEVSHGKWRSFVKWAQKNGFDLVFALNNEEKMDNGLWDPNTALIMLTIADKDNIHDVYWQLGYECKNQSIEEYLNDLETLRVITDTFPSPHKWKVVGGDVTGCLQKDSKSDFKDYVTLSCDMMDAVMLDGNSSTYELDRLSERDRMKLLKVLSESTTPLWLSEKATNEDLGEVSRAVDWLMSLGHAARNGFSVHYKELSEFEMYQPTLSFYMALLYKNLVGEKVLEVDMEPDQAIMFAHCTSLRHKAVPGAVTLYGANMDDEPARLSIKLSLKEDGGDIMQYVLGHDSNGNINVNGKPMYFEGDIKPTVKRVRPYKTLLINLPPKSFGFWVLANTNVGACYENKNEHNKVKDIKSSMDKHSIENGEASEIDALKTKRSLVLDDYVFKTGQKIDDDLEMIDENVSDLITEKVTKPKKERKTNGVRIKRDIQEIEHMKNKIRKIKQKIFRNTDNSPRALIHNIFNTSKRNVTRSKNGRPRKFYRISNQRVHKRQPKKAKESNEIDNSRRRRSIDEVTSSENEIDLTDNAKLWGILRKIHKQLKELPDEDKKDVQRDINENEYIDADAEVGQIDIDSISDIDIDAISDKNIDKTSEVNDVSDYVIEVESQENESHIFKDTIEDFLTVLGDLNLKLNKFFKSIR